jgi:hypothetical protein
MRDFLLSLVRLLLGNAWKRAALLLVAAGTGALTGILQYAVSGLFGIAGHPITIPDAPTWVGFTLIVLGLAVFVLERKFDPHEPELLMIAKSNQGDLKQLLRRLEKGDTAAIEGEKRQVEIDATLNATVASARMEVAETKQPGTPAAAALPSDHKASARPNRSSKLLKRSKEALESGYVGEALWSLVRGVERLPRFRGLVFRGYQAAEPLGNFLNRYEVGSISEWSTYSSASRRAENAFFGNVLFAIQSKTGRELPDYKDEQEIVFLPGTKFKVLAIERQEDNAVVEMAEV